MTDASLRPNVAFLFAHPAHFVALGFGSGLAPFAPGTWGTLVAVPLAMLLRLADSDAAFALAAVGLVVVGAWCADVTARHLGAVDPGSIVIDEIAAFLLVLFFVGEGSLRVAVAFALFRFFDIVKPPPIRTVDEHIRNGWGVMADDLVAAGYTLLVYALGVRAIGALA